MRIERMGVLAMMSDPLFLRLPLSSAYHFQAAQLVKI